MLSVAGGGAVGCRGRCCRLLHVISIDAHLSNCGGFFPDGYMYYGSAYFFIPHGYYLDRCTGLRCGNRNYYYYYYYYYTFIMRHVSGLKTCSKALTR